MLKIWFHEGENCIQIYKFFLQETYVKYSSEQLILFASVLIFRATRVQVMRIWRTARRCVRWHGVDRDGTNVSLALVSTKLSLVPMCLLRILRLLLIILKYFDSC